MDQPFSFDTFPLIFKQIFTLPLVVFTQDRSHCFALALFNCLTWRPEEVRRKNSFNNNNINKKKVSRRGFIKGIRDDSIWWSRL